MSTGATPLVAGIELGGTKCVCLLASGPDAIVDEIHLPTGQPAPTLDAVFDVVSRWKDQHPLAAIGVASFGPLERRRDSTQFGHVLKTPKPGWSGTDLLARVRAFDLPVDIETDVNAAAHAERRWGAAQGLSDFVYVTVGTGVGVGTIIDGRAVGAHAHSEAGHMRVARLPGDHWPGACAFHGDCVEGIACGPAIAARTGRSPETLSDDDPAWDAVVHALAGLFHNLTLTVIPKRILVGGGIATGRPELISRIQQALTASLAGYAHAARGDYDTEHLLAAPVLGRLAGPLGAVAIALRALGR